MFNYSTVGWRLLCGIILLLPLFLSAAETEKTESKKEQLEVQFLGVEGQLLAQVKAFASIEQQKNHPYLSAQRIKHLHQHTGEEIQKSLQAFGYYRVKIKDELKEPVSPEESWQAIYTIELGPQVILASVKVRLRGEGEADSAFIELLGKLPLKEGSPLEHADYEKAKSLFQELAESRGYFEAHFLTKEIRLEMETYQARAVLIFDTGPRYRFGEVRFEQDPQYHFFNDKLLNTFIPFKSGDFYTTAELLKLRSALTTSDYFKLIDLRTERDSQTLLKQVNIAIRLEPRSPNTYRFRLGYGTDSGGRGRIEWKRHYLNRRGHRFSANMGATENKRKLVGELEYQIPTGPLQGLLQDYTALTLRYEGEDFIYSEFGLSKGGSTRHENLWLILSKHHPRRLFGEFSLEEVFNVEYLEESYNFLQLLLTPDKIEEILPLLSDEEKKVLSPSFYAVMPGIKWVYKETDNRIYSTRGQQLEFKLRAAQEGWGANLSFWQAQFAAKVIRALGNKGRVILRGDVSYTDAITVESFNANILPEVVQYRTGGDRSVRGYEFEELSDGLVGGKHLLVGSVEYEHRILESWSAAVFYDTGNAFNNFSHLTLNEGTGIGIRWHSPIGLVRLDVASAISKEGDPWRIHLVVGPDF